MKPCSIKQQCYLLCRPLIRCIQIGIVWGKYSRGNVTSELDRYNVRAKEEVCFLKAEAVAQRKRTPIKLSLEKALNANDELVAHVRSFTGGVCFQFCCSVIYCEASATI